MYKFKRREGINRTKDLRERINVVEELLLEIQFDLKHGWNPVLDPKRENDYNPYIKKKPANSKSKYIKPQARRRTKQDIYNYYFST